MNYDGSEQTRLPTDPSTDNYPFWSPAGKRIGFELLREGHGDIYVINADGSGERQLTTDSADDEPPQWSPAGGR